MPRDGVLTNTVAILLIAITLLGVSHQTSEQTNKKAVIREALRVCISEQFLGSYLNELTRGKNTIIILLAHRIEDAAMPRVMGGVKLQVLSREAIEAKAVADGVFLYMVLDLIQLEDDRAIVKVTLTGIFDEGAYGYVSLFPMNGVWVGEGSLWGIA